jgi:hypothetical protein
LAVSKGKRDNMKSKIMFLIATMSISVGAFASPYLPSQGELTVQKGCTGTSLNAGQKLLIRADVNGVTVTANSETVDLSGHLCGMQSATDMCVIGGNPVLIHDALIYNGFSTMGGMSLGDPLPAGFLVGSSRAIYGLVLFDTGAGIELSGTSYPADGSSGSQNVKCSLSK